MVNPPLQTKIFCLGRHLTQTSPFVFFLSDANEQQQQWHCGPLLLIRSMMDNVERRSALQSIALRFIVGWQRNNYDLRAAASQCHELWMTLSNRYLLKKHQHPSANLLRLAAKLKGEKLTDNCPLRRYFSNLSLSYFKLCFTFYALTLQPSTPSTHGMSEKIGGTKLLSNHYIQWEPTKCHAIKFHRRLEFLVKYDRILNGGSI